MIVHMALPHALRSVFFVVLGLCWFEFESNEVCSVGKPIKFCHAFVLLQTANKKILFSLPSLRNLWMVKGHRRFVSVKVRSRTRTNTNPNETEANARAEVYRFF